MRCVRTALVLVLLAAALARRLRRDDDAAGSGGGDQHAHGAGRRLADRDLHRRSPSDFEADHPGVKVKLAFDSSAPRWPSRRPTAPRPTCSPPPTTATMDAATAGARRRPAGLRDQHAWCWSTPKDNPAGISTLRRPRRAPASTYVACVDTAPCGKVAAALLDDNAASTAKPASEEVDVKAVLAKVTSDEADAGLVYATDAVAAGDAVDGRRDPARRDELTTVPDRARSTQSKHADLAAGSSSTSYLRHGPAGARGRRLRTP